MASRTDVLRIQFEVNGDGQLVAKLKESGNALDSVGSSGKRAGDGLRNFAGGVIAALGVERITRGLIGSIVEFQNLNARLVTLEGSSRKASEQFAKLEEFATKTPFQLAEVVDAYAVLKSRGLDPTIESIDALGNIASASGKGIQQISEATADAITGEFERLKEFGIQARAEGDKVAFTFGETTTVVERSADEILGFLQTLGETEFAGSTARQADTLTGSFSNLIEALGKLAVAVGDAGLTDALRSAIDGLTKGVQAFRAGGGVDALIESFQKLLRVLADIAVFAGGAYVASFVAAGSATTSLIAAQKAFHAALIATRAFMTAAFGPIGLLVAGVGLLSVGLFELVTADTEADRAAKLHGETRDAVNRITKEGTADAREAAVALLAQAEAQLKLTEAALETAKARRPDLPDIAFNGRDSRIAKLRQDITDLKTALSDDAVSAVLEFVDELEKVEPAATGASDAVKKAIEASDKYIGSLVEQIATLGLSRAELIRWQAQQEAAKAVTKQQRDQILALAEALVAKTEATEKDTKAEATAKKARQDLLRLTQDFGRLQADQAVALKGPAEEVRQFYASVLEQIDAFEKKLIALGQLTPEIAARIAAARTDAATIFTRESADAEQQAREAADRQLNEYLGVWGQGIDEVGNIITDGLFNGFKDAGDDLLDLFRNILHDLAREAIQNEIVIPIKQKLSGLGVGNAADGQPDGGEGGSAPGSSGGGLILAATSIAGSALGGAIGGKAGAIGGQIGGAVFGLVGAVVGSLIGAAIGSVFGGGKPNVEVRSRTFSGVEASSSSRLGNIFVDTDKTGKAGDAQELANALKKLDDSIAGLLEGDEIQRATAALADFGVKIKGKNLDTAEIFDARLNAVIDAVEPTFARFLRGIDDIDQRLQAFQGIREIEKMLGLTEQVIDALDPSPIGQLRAQMRLLNDAVDDTAKALTGAIAAQDPVAIQQAAAAAQQAIIQRFAAEVQLARQLEQTLVNAQKAARDFDVALLQRLTFVGAAAADAVTASLSGSLAGAQSRVLGAIDPDRALGFLDEFIGTVDAWLQSARADVQRIAAEQTDAANARMTELDAERQAIDQQLALAQSLRQSMLDAAVAAEQFAVDIAQRLVDVGVDTQQQFAALLAANAGSARDRVTGAADASAALGFLDDFIGTVDAWLQNARDGVQQILDEQTTIATDALATLDAERQRILDGARAVLQQRQEIEREALQSQRDALNEQLGLARQWLGVLNQSKTALDALKFGNANPLDGGARLALLDAQIGALRSARDAASGAARASISSELIGALNQRIGLAQSLFDRPSAEFLDVFNGAVTELSALQAEAGAGSSEIDRLQSALGALQQGTTSAVDEQSALLSALAASDRERLDAIAVEQSGLQQHLIDLQDQAQARLQAINAEAAAYYEWARTTGEALQQQRANELAEQLAAITADPARLDAIAAEQAALQQQLIDIQAAAKAQLDAINGEAAGYYEWARTTGNDLQQQRLQDIADRLQALTGGTDVDAFIAARQAEAADLLRSIDSNLRAFLDSIRTDTGASPGVPAPGGPGAPSPPGEPGRPGFPGFPAPVIQVAPGAISVTVSGNLSPQQTAAAVSAQIEKQLPQLASKLLREMKVA